MKKRIKKAIKNIQPKKLNVDSINISSFKKLGLGECNLNYLFSIKNKKFICRVNFCGETERTKKEYTCLKAIEGLDVGPKAFYLHKANKSCPQSFIILEYIEGKPFRMRKRAYTPAQAKELARALAKLHNKKSKLLKKDRAWLSYKENLERSKEFERKINRFTKNKSADKLKRLQAAVKEAMPKKETHKIGLTHGDIYPQNIIQTKNNKLKLIDWESLELSDPARDISCVMMNLGFKGKLLELFLKEYHKIRKDKTILSRAKKYRILMRHHYILWEIMRSFEIIHKKMPIEYLRKTTAKLHITEAKYQYRQLKKTIKLPEIDIDSFFKNIR
ncbi:aminoglycoside phosphotransferase family protein [Candidatus Woesearchaeota archaeon]|nr:aminoglycoside phosphotransferase family protein [Candidatus Woesearchaeota archaeon]MBW3005253.1 aminoglycoside phosphotransferase family protein [Candidatus Woesearchaeota archaeon]